MQDAKVPTGSGLWTIPEVAERFRVSPATVYGWIKRKVVNAVRIPGGKLRIRNRDVKKIAEQQ